MFEVLYSKTALNHLKSIPTNKQKLILEKIDMLKINPFQSNKNIKKLVGIKAFRLRVGDYRIIYEIKSNEIKLLIIDIDSRGNIYEK